MINCWLFINLILKSLPLAILAHFGCESGYNKDMCQASLISFEGRVREISFSAPDSGYTVLLCKDHDSQQLVTVTGDLALVREQELLRFYGQWVRHPRFGRQFRVQYYQAVLPAGCEGIETFLASGLIRGLGPATARRLVAAWGEQTLQILDLQPERLAEIPGLGTKRRAQILASWQAHRGLQPVVQLLQQANLPLALAPRLYQAYGPQAPGHLSQFPYELSFKWGLGLQQADRFARLQSEARQEPWDPTRQDRLQAGLKQLLREASREGHLYLPLPELLDQAAERLQVKPGVLVPALDPLFEQGQFWPEPLPAGQSYDIYLSKLARAEQESAEHLKALLATPEPPDPALLTTWLETYQREQQLPLSEGQCAAIQMAIARRVMILTGGPGTGKTTVSKAILSWFRAQKLRFRLASPTGRAARRLSEVTGAEAVTLHRLLEYDPHSGGFQRHADHPLETDLVMLDEVSMIDMELFAHFLSALTPDTRLILIGDADQLPSVGPGAVLAELLRSGVIPAVHLTEIYRQAQASLIVRNAHRVNQGQLPVLLPPRGQHRHEDAFFIACETDLHAQLRELCAQRLPAAGYAARDIQVLAPMRRGPAGTEALNHMLQDALNPAAPQIPELKVAQRIFRCGDRIIQLKNNYTHEIFNGDLGTILALTPATRQLQVAFADRVLTLADEDLQTLDLAYALTIHKAQGAEFPVVILVLTRQHHVMLQRNLLYTAMTRARRLLIILGDEAAVARAVAHERLKQRYTRLAERLRT